MSNEAPSVRAIPVDQITVLNPRSRNKRVFQELVTSIARLGLKKPITVSQSAGKEGFVLVCGQGRLEAFLALGQAEIPAVVIDASEEDCFVMSLVENIARRQHTSLELMREIGALKSRGYSIAEIAAKTDFSVEYITAVLFLQANGEDRLIKGVERGVIPHCIAMEIARAKEGDVQQALADAYERKLLPGHQVMAIRKIIEERNHISKGLGGARPVRIRGKQVTADSLIRTYEKETERQKLLVRRASLAQARLLFLVNGLRALLREDHFTTLLRAEQLQTMPRPLADRLHAAQS